MCVGMIALKNVEEPKKTPEKSLGVTRGQHQK